MTRERQQALLEQTRLALTSVLHRIGQGAGEELIAEELRCAATSLGRLTGRVDVEEVLEMIFREFCVGK